VSLTRGTRNVSTEHYTIHAYTQSAGDAVTVLYVVARCCKCVLLFALYPLVVTHVTGGGQFCATEWGTALLSFS